MKFLVIFALSLCFAAQISAQIDEDALKKKTEETVCRIIKERSSADGVCAITDWEHTSYTTSFSLNGQQESTIPGLYKNMTRYWSDITKIYHVEGSLTCELSINGGWVCRHAVNPFSATMQTEPCTCKLSQSMEWSPCGGPRVCGAKTSRVIEGLRLIDFGSIDKAIPVATDKFLTPPNQPDL